MMDKLTDITDRFFLASSATVLPEFNIDNQYMGYYLHSTMEFILFLIIIITTIIVNMKNYYIIYVKE